MARSDRRFFSTILRIGAVALILLAVVVWPDVGPALFSQDGNVTGELRPYFIALSLGTAVGAAAGLALSRLLPSAGALALVFALSLLILAELGTAAVLQRFGESHISPLEGFYSFHPVLGGIHTPNYDRATTVMTRSGAALAYRNNAEGFRAPPRAEADEGRFNIVVVGGSTAYDLAVGTGETWPEKLEEALGQEVSVFNLGQSGHASPQHVVLTALLASDYKPDLILFYMGLNDARNGNVVDLLGDFSRFHMPSLYESFAVKLNHYGFLAIPTAAKRALSAIGFLEGLPTPVAREGASAATDRLVVLYRRNVRTLAAISRSLGAEPVFLPQLVNREMLAASTSSFGWAPFLTDRQLLVLTDRLNAAMIDAAESVGAAVARELADVDLANDHFSDQAHFSPSGSNIFAQHVGTFLENEGLLPPNGQ